MPTMDYSDLSDLFADVNERHITGVESPMGQEVVFYIDHKNGNEYRLEVKFGGSIFLHKRVGGEWEVIHSA